MERSNGLGSKAQVYTDLSQLTQLKRDAKSHGCPTMGWRLMGRTGGDMSLADSWVSGFLLQAHRELI